jgi:hypothetical protein
LAAEDFRERKKDKKTTNQFPSTTRENGAAQAILN